MKKHVQFFSWGKDALKFNPLNAYNFFFFQEMILFKNLNTFIKYLPNSDSQTSQGWESQPSSHINKPATDFRKISKENRLILKKCRVLVHVRDRYLIFFFLGT